MRLRALIALPCLALALAVTFPSNAEAIGSPNVAALQIGLRAHGFDAGTVDGILGRQTRRSVRAFQRRAGLVADGIPGPRTRRALGRYGRPRLGRRVLRLGMVGWDVGQLQFLLAWHGFPSGTMDGAFGPHTRAAVRRFQRFARLGVDGVAGPATIAALHHHLPRSPLRVSSPMAGHRLTDRFGPRGARFHTGIDFAANYGAGVAAARYGRVVYAGWHNAGYGYLVAIAHGRRVRTFYAHLSRMYVRRGQRVGTGWQIGLVGSTGNSTGPHLHFEVRYRGAAVDPLTALR